LGSHPVAVVQYTHDHKQYRERHKTNNTYNNTKIRNIFPCICCVERRSMKFVANAEKTEKEFHEWYVVGSKQVYKDQL